MSAPDRDRREATSVRDGTASGSDSAPKRSRYLRLIIVLAFTVLMTFFALRSSPYLEYIPWMPRRLGIWADHHGVFRNTVAFFAFGLVTFVLLGIRAGLVAGVCVFATMLEVAQLCRPHRVFDWKDIVASIAGVLLAWPIAWAARHLFSPRCSRA